MFSRGLIVVFSHRVFPALKSGGVFIVGMLLLKLALSFWMVKACRL